MEVAGGRTTLLALRDAIVHAPLGMYLHSRWVPLSRGPRPLLTGNTYMPKSAVSDRVLQPSDAHSVVKTHFCSSALTRISHKYSHSPPAKRLRSHVDLQLARCPRCHLLHAPLTSSTLCAAQPAQCCASQTAACGARPGAAACRRGCCRPRRWCWCAAALGRRRRCWSRCRCARWRRCCLPLMLPTVYHCALPESGPACAVPSCSDTSVPAVQLLPL